MSSNTAAPGLAARLRRGEILDVNCPARVILSHVTSRWGVLVLIALRPENLRFGELRRRIGGVSERMLTQTLKSLEADGFIDRNSFPVVPPHVEYGLTESGHEISRLLEGIVDWIEGNAHRSDQEPEGMD